MDTDGDIIKMSDIEGYINMDFWTLIEDVKTKLDNFKKELKGMKIYRSVFRNKYDNVSPSFLEALDNRICIVEEEIKKLENEIEGAKKAYEAVDKMIDEKQKKKKRL